jgi:hypothetical protein
MTCSHSLFVAKLARGTVPHGIAHIRSSLGHRTLHEHSAVAGTAEVATENTMRRPASRRVIARRRRPTPRQRDANESGTERDGGTMKR